MALAAILALASFVPSQGGSYSISSLDNETGNGTSFDNGTGNQTGVNETTAGGFRLDTAIYEAMNVLVSAAKSPLLLLAILILAIGWYVQRVRRKGQAPPR